MKAFGSALRPYRLTWTSVRGACLTELASIRGRFGLGIERDLHFEADKPISAYLANWLGRIQA